MSKKSNKGQGKPRGFPSATGAERVDKGELLNTQAAVAEAFARESALSGRRLEVWTWLALALGLMQLGVLFYLGMRTEGLYPVIAYRVGLSLLSMAALFVLFVGTLWSIIRRPFLQRRRTWGFVTLVLMVGVGNYPFPFPSSHSSSPSTVRFELPVRGEWTVLWGGEKLEHNRLAGYLPDRRWGLDLVITDGDGRSASSESQELSEFYAYNQPVYAPCAGVVVGARGAEPDQPVGERLPGSTLEGNLLVLEVAEGEFLFLSNLKQDSLTVKEGDRVQAGQLLARVGRSGMSPFTPEPHLGLHLQDSPDPQWGQAIPWRIHDYFAFGVPVEAGLPKGGKQADGSFTGTRVRRMNALPEPPG